MLGYILLLLHSLALITNAGNFNHLDFYSSTLRNQPLLEVHSQVLKMLRNYAEVVSQVSTELNRFLSDSEIQAVSGPWSTDGDPLRSYLLIRRTSKDIEDILAPIHEMNSIDPTSEIEGLKLLGSVPNIQDLFAIARGLLRMQRLYGMTSAQLAQGRLTDNLQVPISLSASDCLFLGELNEMFTEKPRDSVDTMSWYEEGIIRSQEITTEEYIPRKLQSRLANLKHREGERVKFLRETPNVDQNENMVSLPDKRFHPDELYETYARICRGNRIRSEKSGQYTNGSNTVDESRVSVTSWLTDDDIPKVSERLGVFVGMNANATLYDAENLQVLNYGVGGHYNPHEDFFSGVTLNGGNRIATLMIYLSDVEEGGGTAFPYLGVGLKPKKGSAGFWWNLNSAGEGDFRTTHGACPVIYGSKWVTNKWFRHDSQMFKVPCSQRENESIKPL